MFEGVAGTGYAGDIALDDISVTNGPCTPSKICDFEIDQCGYANDPLFPLKWIRDNNGTSSVGTGPSVDHTTGSDKGMLAKDTISLSEIIMEILLSLVLCDICLTIATCLLLRVDPEAKSIIYW